MDKNLCEGSKDIPPGLNRVEVYFDTIQQILLQWQEVPKELQIRELLAEYYRMVQGPQELVSDFAHRF